MLLGLLGNPWRLQDGRVEVDPNPAAPARYIPMVNPEVVAGPTVTKKRRECQTHLHHEEDGVWVRSDLGLQGLLGDRTNAVRGQDHYVYRERPCTREPSRRQFDQAKPIRPSGAGG